MFIFDFGTTRTNVEIFDKGFKENFFPSYRRLWSPPSEIACLPDAAAGWQ